MQSRCVVGGLRVKCAWLGRADGKAATQVWRLRLVLVIGVRDKKSRIMTNLTAGLTALAWLVVCSPAVQATTTDRAIDATDSVSWSQEMALLTSQDATLPTPFSESVADVQDRDISNTQLQKLNRPISEIGLFGLRRSETEAIYKFSSASRVPVSGYLSVTNESALGIPTSAMRRFAGIDSPDPVLPSHWLDSPRSHIKAVAAGYAWRDIKLEGAASSGGSHEESRPVRGEPFKLASRSARLSFHPSQNWIVQLSRGSLSGLDQLVPGGDVRRTTLSATYHQAFREGEWQTTLAWGRNSRKYRETTVGYLLESTLRFSGAHVMFGRLEQAASDELMRENESLQRQLFKMNKLTVGYFRDLRISSSLKVDVGAFVSRHFVPSPMIPSYGNNPTAYMMFVRVSLQ